METLVERLEMDTTDAFRQRGVIAGAMLRVLPCIMMISTFGLIAGCGSSSEYPSGQTGGAYFYAPGTPRFEFMATTGWEGQQSGLSLRISLPNSSLVFLLEEGLYQARHEVIARLFDEEGERLAKEMMWPETTTVTQYSITQDSRPTVSTYFLPSGEGRFLLRVSVRDANSGKSATLEQRVLITLFHADLASIASVTLEVLNNGEASFTPMIPPFLRRDYDSLRLSCIVHSPAVEDEHLLRILVRSFPTDTSVAPAPFLFSHIQSSFPAVGVDFDSPDTVVVIQHALVSAAGKTAVSVPIPHLLEGFYRFTITLVSRSVSGDTAMAQTLDASVFGPGFPRPLTIDDLIEPLVYLAGKTDLDSLRGATTQWEKKTRFDAFWLSDGASKQAAANAIKQYYTRVEEANRFFSTHKEGWRTDRGMIYVVLGPPLAVSHILQKEVWFYSNTEQDPLNTYVFTQAQSRIDSPLLNNYILNRQSYYESTWQKALERWRRAAVF